MMYQVIIVGAGPAGAYLAYLLSREGIRVLLLEKERLPRNKTCAGGLTAKSVRLLADFNLQPLIEDNVHKVIFSCKRARPLELNFNRPLVRTVNRLKFDSFLTRKAKEAGAEVLDGINVTKVQQSKDYVTVSSNGKEWRGKLLAGADGALSTVAKSCDGFAANKRIMASLLEQQIYLPTERMEQNRGIIKMDYGILPAGYTWLFPKSDHISVGIGSIGLKAGKLRELLGKAIQSKGYTPSFNSSPVRGWFIPVMLKSPVLHQQRIFLLGDAAGLVDALTGEGIFAALFSARMAAEVIIEQIKKEQPNLESYTAQVKEKLWPELRSSYNIGRWFYLFPGIIHRLFRYVPDFSNIFELLFAGELTYAEFIKIGGKRLLPI